MGEHYSKKELGKDMYQFFIEDENAGKDGNNADTHTHDHFQIRSTRDRLHARIIINKNHQIKHGHRYNSGNQIWEI